VPFHELHRTIQSLVKVYTPLAHFATLKRPSAFKNTIFLCFIYIFTQHAVGIILWNCEKYDNAVLVRELFEKIA
jgi:heme A synthase